MTIHHTDLSQIRKIYILSKKQECKTSRNHSAALHSFYFVSNFTVFFALPFVTISSTFEASV